MLYGMYRITGYFFNKDVKNTENRLLPYIMQKNNICSLDEIEYNNTVLKCYKEKMTVIYDCTQRCNTSYIGVVT